MYKFSETVPSQIKEFIIKLFDYLKEMDVYKEDYLERINETVFVISKDPCIDIVYDYKGKQYEYKKNLKDVCCFYNTIILYDEEQDMYVRAKNLIFLMESMIDPVVVFHELLHLLSSEVIERKFAYTLRSGISDTIYYFKSKMKTEKAGVTWLNEALTSLISEDIAKYYGFVDNYYTLHNNYCYTTKTLRLFNLKAFGAQCNKEILSIYLDLKGREYISFISENVSMNNSELIKFFELLSEQTKNIIFEPKNDEAQQLITNRLVPFYKKVIEKIENKISIKEIMQKDLFYFI